MADFLSVLDNSVASTGPDYHHEDMLLKSLRSSNENKTCLVCGVDEVGRGPLAGPVVAAAVILDPNQIPAGLNDSKKLSAKKRALLDDAIRGAALDYAIAEASVDEIDEHNILQATFIAMRRAVENLKQRPIAALVDGNKDPNLGIETRTLIKGDSRSLSIAAASILAKNYRDELMATLAKDYPDYGWERNAGYGVPAHKKSLELVGVSPHHRKSFDPIRSILNAES